MQKNKPSKLLDANTAVESYLDNLLQEATEAPKVQPKKRVVQKAENTNIHVLETPLTVELAHPEESLATEELIEEADLEKFVEPKSEQFTFPIQCLMFKVKGHLLSVPLIRMGSVVPWGDRLTQLPHSPGYFKGLLKHRDGNVRVIDTASLLMNVVPSVDDDEFSPSHLLVFEGDTWAISCDELMSVVTLNEDDIKWHTGEGDRLSFGTIKSSLALVLNPDAITDKLLKGDNS